jgi:predicted membrane protein
MVIIWGFFIIAKIHSLKFKSYQPKIIKISSFVNIVIIILTILWYIFIFINYSGSNTYTLEWNNQNKWKIEKNIDNFTDIKSERQKTIDNAWNDYY